MMFVRDNNRMKKSFNVKMNRFQKNGTDQTIFVRKRKLQGKNR